MKPTLEEVLKALESIPHPRTQRQVREIRAKQSRIGLEIAVRKIERSR